MKPIKFDEANCTYAENQPPYLPLPAHRSDDGLVTSCWSLGWLERMKVLLLGRVYVCLRTANEPLQPLKLWVAP